VGKGTFPKYSSGVEIRKKRMSGLPPGQFTDYLIIGIITSTFAVLLELFLKHRSIKPRTRFGALVALLAAAALIAYFKVQTHSPPRAETGTGDGPSPTATVFPTGTPPITPSPTPQITPGTDTYVDTFLHNNVAPLPRSDRRSGQWAVAISDRDSKENYSKLASVVSSVIGEAGHSTVAIFRPSATHGTQFDTLFAADPALARRLSEYCDQILLGKVTSSIQENPSYPGLHSLTMTIDIKIISTRSGDVQQVRTAAVGAGYEIGEARSNAEERLASNLRSELHNVIR
jgi:hypothetical protein